MAEDLTPEALKRVPSFAELTTRQLEELIKRFSIRDLADETVVCEKGGRAKEFFIILAGQAHIVKGESGHAVTLQPGTFFGEAVFKHVNSVRSATVQTQGRTTRLAVLTLADWNAYKASTDTTHTVHRVGMSLSLPSLSLSLSAVSLSLSLFALLN